MKKSLLVLAALAAAVAVSAQPDSAEARRWLLSHQQRDASQHHLRSSLAQHPAHPSTKTASELPADGVWFPGEWEEVQAVLVTPYYTYTSPDGSKIADPLMGGVAEYYNKPTSAHSSGTGPYVSHLDTANVSGIGDVSFRLMDAIQRGGAEAWVRVETADDTAAVLRKLASMGLRSDSVRFFVAPGNSFWYRDCGPICFYFGAGDTVGMLDFEYYPGRALDDSLPAYVARETGMPLFRSTLEWEGGNCLVDGSGAVVTSNHIYAKNGDSYGQLEWDGSDPATIGYSTKTRLSQEQTRNVLRGLVGQRALHVLQQMRHDGGTGHVDLFATMTDENTFVAHRMPTAYNLWNDYRTLRRNVDSLCSYRTIFDCGYTMRRIPFPNNNSGTYYGSEEIYTRYTRSYANNLMVNRLLVVPCYSDVDTNHMPTTAWDSANVEQVKAAFPGYEVYCIDVRGFDGLGGSTHCISKQIPASNPVRILHRRFADTVAIGPLEAIPVSAVVTNCSGIAHAEVIWREAGADEWDTIDLTANGNRYHGTMPRIVTAIPQHTIEYYISATSNNGKTVTKPMTASQGGWYRFTYTDDLTTFDSAAFDFDTMPLAPEALTYTMSVPANTGIAPVETDDDDAFGNFYPNPAVGRADMIVNLGDGMDCDVTIYDLGGRIVHTSSLQAAGEVVYSIDTSRLPSGMYTVVFHNTDIRVARKLIVR